MTVENHHSNASSGRLSMSSYLNSGPFQKLFDVTQHYLYNNNNNSSCNNSNNNNANSSSTDSPKRFSLDLPKLESRTPPVSSSNNSHWKHQPPSYMFPPFPHHQIKYFPPPPPPPPPPHHSIDLLATYLHHHHHHSHHHHGPSPDLIKYIEKVREDEMAVKLKDRPEVKLCEDELWKKFNGLTTEMVITKSGRRMFPAFKVQLSGLDPKSRYVLALEIAPCDDNRFKFHNGKWTLAGKADPESHRLVHIHCESPATGDAWMQKAVWFNKVKLTNNPTDKDPQHLVLNSMHKYVMRLHIFRCDETSKVRFCIYPEIFTFKTTEFIAVTAYQNDKITQLKIDNNPFAKGFRDNGSGRREKKRLKTQQTITSTSPDSAEDSAEEETGSNSLDQRYRCGSPVSVSAGQSGDLDQSNVTNSDVVVASTVNSVAQKRRADTDVDFHVKRRNAFPNARAAYEWDRAGSFVSEETRAMQMGMKGVTHTVHYTPQKWHTAGSHQGWLESLRSLCSLRPPPVPPSHWATPAPGQHTKPLPLIGGGGGHMHVLSQLHSMFAQGCPVPPLPQPPRPISSGLLPSSAAQHTEVDVDDSSTTIPYNNDKTSPIHSSHVAMASTSAPSLPSSRSKFSISSLL